VETAGRIILPPASALALVGVVLLLLGKLGLGRPPRHAAPRRATPRHAAPRRAARGLYRDA
jgi:hypothetical protein